MNHIRIRKLNHKYIDCLRKWRNQNRKYFFNKSIIKREDQEIWYKNYLKNPNDTAYIIFYRDTPVGTFSLINDGNDFELGRVILGDKRYESQGVMGDALEMVLSKFPTKRVYLKVIGDNYKAINFYIKHNFCIIEENKKQNYLVMDRII